MSVLLKLPLAVAILVFDTAAVLLLPTVKMLGNRSTPVKLLPSDGRTVALGLLPELVRYDSSVLPLGMLLLGSAI
jgi:hypothetical protein